MARSSLYWQFQGDFERARLAMYKRRDYLLRCYPEIVDQYRRGDSLAEIAQRCLPDDYEISQNIAKNSVLYALAKLLTPGEKRELGLQHKRDAYKKRKDLNGKCVKEGPIKNPKRVAAGKRAYTLGVSHSTSKRLAQVCVDNMIRRGIYPYEGEVRFVNTGLNGHQVLYPMNEKDYILFLRNQRGLIWSEIEKIVNDSFNGNGRRKRKANAIRVSYQSWVNGE